MRIPLTQIIVLYNINIYVISKKIIMNKRLVYKVKVIKCPKQIKIIDLTKQSTLSSVAFPEPINI